MPKESSSNNLFVINFITGMSDGLMLPFAACIIAYPFFDTDAIRIFWVGLIVSVIGGLVFGLARYFGEREEIRHHHPQLAMNDAKKELTLMRNIGIAEAITEDMEMQMEQGRLLWLQEVRENGMGWEEFHRGRALRSGMHTTLGFVLAGILVGVPFCFTNEGIEHLILPSIFYLLLISGFGWIKGKLLGTNVRRSVAYKFCTGFIVLVAALVISMFIHWDGNNLFYPNNVPVIESGKDDAPQEMELGGMF